MKCLTIFIVTSSVVVYLPNGTTPMLALSQATSTARSAVCLCEHGANIGVVPRPNVNRRYYFLPAVVDPLDERHLGNSTASVILYNWLSIKPTTRGARLFKKSFFGPRHARTAVSLKCIVSSAKIFVFTRLERVNFTLKDSLCH